MEWPFSILPETKNAPLHRGPHGLHLTEYGLLESVKIGTERRNVLSLYLLAIRPRQ
jgi:hypothetical protein